MAAVGRVIALGLAVALAGACGGGDDDPELVAPDAELATSLGLPATPAGAQLAWVLTDGAAAADDELSERFSAGFLAEVPPDQLRAVLGDLGSLHVGEVRTSVPTRLETIVSASDGTSLLATIELATDDGNRITTLLFQPADPAPVPTSWDEIDGRLGALASRAALVAAEVATDGTLVDVHARDADSVGPIGSAFKLYVLGALADAIGAGTVAWDDELEIDEVDRSLPTGRLQDEVGSTVTVREAATLMISISDNTATDRLVRQLGRAAVEAVLPSMGLGADATARTLPFLTTREVFILKWGVDVELLAAYAGATEADRRQLLPNLPGELPPASAVRGAPVEIDRVEWFASPRELAAAHVFLDGRRLEDGLEPLNEILTTNPGLQLPPESWTRVAFKGGGEPGVLALAWLLERADGRRFVLAMKASDPTRAIDQNDAVAIASGAIALLAVV